MGDIVFILTGLMGNVVLIRNGFMANVVFILTGFMVGIMKSLYSQGGGAEKRPATDLGKKPKVQKKKKKKDPNEPQKPVSAYALFFRDTQAAIKGQNPSATFGGGLQNRSVHLGRAGGGAETGAAPC